MSGPQKHFPSLRRASQGRPCAHCGREDGTTVRAHYTGFRQHAFGKGFGTKGHDLAAADLCHECHAWFDDPEMKIDIDKSEKFLFVIVKTLIKDLEEGIIKI